MNVGNIQIRQATISDAKEIALVHLKAWQESYHGIIDQSYLDSIDFEERLSLRKSILLNPGELSIHLVAIVDNKLVGFCSAGPCPDFSDEARGEICAIYLLEAYKNLGIGGLFMQKVSDLLTQTGQVLREKKERATITYRDLVVRLGDQAFGLIIILFALPSALPQRRATLL